MLVNASLPCLFQAGDAGRYKITASNGIGDSAVHEFDINVERAPKFTQVPRDVTLTEGTEHEIVAVITGVPEPAITITDNKGEQILGDIQYVQVDKDTYRFTLTLPDVQVSV